MPKRHLINDPGVQATRAPPATREETTMTIDRRLLAGAIGLVLAVAACGGSSTASSGATAAPTTTAGATAAPATAAPATEAPAPTYVPTATDDNAPEASFAAGSAGDLEATLPDEAGGIKFSKTSFDGASLGAAGMGIDTGELAPLLKKYGKSVSDVRMAIAAPANASGTETAMVIALQVKGIPGNELLGVTGTDTSGLTTTSIGGKSVLSANAGGYSMVVYVKDDVLYEVLLASPAVAEAIVQQLP
jgi:hypothetical protein